MTKKIIAIDAMGGDHAPQAVVEGVNRALADFPDLHVELYGKQEQILQYLTSQERVTIVHTDEKIASDDDPMVAVRRKKGSSMMLAIRSVKDGRAQAVVSAGNTGALLLAGTTVVKTIKGVERPGLLSTLPTMDGRGFDMLDLGANPESKPENLRQYAILGTFHAQKVRGITNPRVGLLNNGTETIKGDPLRRDTYQLLSEDKTINFIGNVESRDLLNGVCDVVVTDGFTGNAVLKAIEGTAKAMKDQLSSAIKTGNLFAQIGGFLIRPTLTKKLSSLDYRKSGGAVLFGLRAPVIKAHGSSDDEAIYHTIKQALAIVSSGVVEASSEAFGDK